MLRTNRTRWTVMLCLMLGLLVQRSGGAAQRDQFMVYGPTEESCESWLAASGAEETALEWWLLGFVSGADLMSEQPLRSSDSEGLAGWVDRYCAEHPLDPIVKAAIDLVAELGSPAEAGSPVPQ